MTTLSIDKNYRPRLSMYYSCEEFNREQYTICIDTVESPIKLNVNRLTKRLLDQIDGNCNMEELTLKFNESNNLALTTNDIVNIFNKQLLGYGILEGDNTEKIKIKDEYIYLRFTIIPSRIVRKITPLFNFLFHKSTFVTLFALGFIFLTFAYLQNLSITEFYNVTDPWLTALYIGIIYGSLILHEFGHAAACERFGAKSGDIGFGFYVLTPVFYADITDAWRLKRNERIIIDLAGIYMQLLVCVLLVMAFYFTGSQICLYISFSIGLSFLVNFNPFLRFDGYWALSDLLKIPNLKDKSIRAIGLFFGKIVGKNKDKVNTSPTNIFLICYGSTRIIALFLFVIYMVVFNSHSILYFPINIFNFITSLVTNTENITYTFVKDNLLELLIPFIFYFMFIKALYNKLSRKWKERNTVAHV